MTKNEFAALLARGPLLADGSTGAELSRRGMPAGVCPEQWVLEHEDVFIAMQRDYIAAGSRMLLTPTFGASPLKLREYGLDGDTEAINARLAALTRRVAVDGVLCAAEIGPTGAFLAPLGEVTFEEMVSVFARQVKGLLQAEPDLFILETFMDLSEIRAAILAIRDACDLPIIAGMTFEGDRTLTGAPPQAVLQALTAAGADVVGANCSSGPVEMGRVLQAMAADAQVPLFAKPNAGIPRMENGRTVFPMGPEEFARGFDGILAAGVGVVGGCCGAGAGHVAALAKRLMNYHPKETPPGSPRLTGPRGVLKADAANPAIVAFLDAVRSPALCQALREGDDMAVADLAREYRAMGARAFYVRCTASGLDEGPCLRGAVEQLSAMVPLPLILSATSALALEPALRRYPGRAGVDLIGADPQALPSLLDTARRYGALPLLSAEAAASYDEPYFAPAGEAGQSVLGTYAQARAGTETPRGAALILADLGDPATAKSLGLD